MKSFQNSALLRLKKILIQRTVLFKQVSDSISHIRVVSLDFLSEELAQTED